MTLDVVGYVTFGFVCMVFISYGLLHDFADRRNERRMHRARRALALVLFTEEVEAERAFASLIKLPKRALLTLVQNVSVDVGDAAYERLRGIVLDARLTRRIHRLARRRAWRRRVQGAHLEHLLPDDDPYRLRLLHDRHPLVRARAAESLPREDVVANAELLLEMLDDPVHSVRVGAQQALLHADARIAEHLCGYLWSGARAGTNLALEIAANLPDPRYGPVLIHNASDSDPVRRAMVAGALGAGALLDGLPTLIELLEDGDARVRANAAAAVAAVGASNLVASLGRMLADPSWIVRREAGKALDALGAPGAVVLRSELFNDDRYARDMARQILDAAAARRRRPPVVIPQTLPPLESFVGETEVA